MCQHISLSIETEEFKNLLKSIENRLVNLDDKKSIPIIKKKAPFIPNMLVSKMVMMARPTYPYIEEMKNMIEYANKDFKKDIQDKAAAWTKRPKNWFFFYHYSKQYEAQNRFVRECMEEVNDHVMVNVVGHDFWDQENHNGRAWLYHKPGMCLTEYIKKGQVQKYEKKVMPKSIFKWILNFGGFQRFNPEAYEKFCNIITKSIEHVLSLSVFSSRLARNLNNINKKYPYFFTICPGEDIHAIPLNIKFYIKNGKVKVFHMASSISGKTYQQFHF